MPPTEIEIIKANVVSLSNSIVDLIERCDEIDRRYIELSRYLKDRVFPRLDRIETELQIDEPAQ